MAKVAVLGAGFVGLSAAYWLMRDGHQVSVFDPAGAAGGASFGNAGTFANYACIPVNNPSVFRDLPRYLLSGDSPLRLRWAYLPQLAPWLARFLISSTHKRYAASATALAALLARAQAGYTEMVAQAGLEPFVRRSECLYLYSGAAAYRASEPKLALRRSLGIECRVVDPEEVQQLEPQLAPIFERGILFPGSWFLSDPSAFLNTLQSWLLRSGLRVERVAAQRIEPQAQGVLVHTSAGGAGFDYVAVCAGAHSRPFALQCGDAVPLDAERGYHLMYPGSTALISRPVGWAERPGHVVVTIELDAADRPGLLADTTRTIADSGADILSSSTAAVEGRSRQRFELAIDELVVLDVVCARLRAKVRGVASVRRI